MRPVTFFSARAFKVKVLEFGWGFPPRMFGIYTGRTLLSIPADVYMVDLEGREHLRPGMRVRVHAGALADGALSAIAIEGPYKGNRAPNATLQEALGKEIVTLEGKVREAGEDSMVLADMVYSINWLPLGGFVRMAGENNPDIPWSLASKGPLTRFTVLAAGSAMNIVLPVVLFVFLFAVPEERYEGRVFIAGVAQESPAERAGLLGGDIILEADGHEVYNTETLRYRILLNLGQETDFLVMRPERLITGSFGFSADAGPVDDRRARHGAVHRAAGAALGPAGGAGERRRPDPHHRGARGQPLGQRADSHSQRLCAHVGDRLVVSQ